MEQEITTTGKALGSLLFNMQMTGYMSASGVFAPLVTRRSRTIHFLEKFALVRSREVFFWLECCRKDPIHMIAPAC